MKEAFKVVNWYLNCKFITGNAFLEVKLAYKTSQSHIEWANTAGGNVVNGEKERWRYCIGGGGNAHLWSKHIGTMRVASEGGNLK